MGRLGFEGVWGGYIGFGGFRVVRVLCGGGGGFRVVVWGSGGLGRLKFVVEVWGFRV